MVALGPATHATHIVHKVEQLTALAKKAAASLSALPAPSQLSDVEEMLNFLAEELPAVKEAVASLGEDYVTVRIQAAGLVDQVKELQKERDDRLAAAAASQGRILLGEVAIGMDKVVAAYVCGPPVPGQQKQGSAQQPHLVPGPYTMQTLKNLAKGGKMSAAQLARWQQVVQYVTQQGWDLKVFLGFSQTLKELRKDDAHSTPTIKASVTKEQLQQHVQNEALWATDFVDFASRFGCPDKPLVPVADVGAVLRS